MTGHRLPVAPILLVSAAMTIAGLACSRHPKIDLDADPASASFLDQAVAIMTEEEVETFRAIPDPAARAEMIRDFWKLRDPDGDGERNAFRTEFDERVAFANKWFSATDPIRGRDVPGREHPKDGSRSDRGRVYILFGPGDKMGFNAEGHAMSDAPRGDMRVPWFRKVTDDHENDFESWYYFENDMVAMFTKTSSGRWTGGPSDNMVWMVEESKRRPVEAHYGGSSTKPLTFRAGYDGVAIRLEVPAEGVFFGEDWTARLGITVNVYRDGARVDRLREERRIESGEKTGTRGGGSEVEVAYVPAARGRFGLEIILDDLGAPRFSRCRRVLWTEVR